MPASHRIKPLRGKHILETILEGSPGIVICGVVFAADCGLRRRLGRKYRYDHDSHYLLSVGHVRAYFHQYGRHFAMQCDGAGDG